MIEQQWFYANNKATGSGKSKGPATDLEIESLIRSGDIKPSDFLLSPSVADGKWVEVISVTRFSNIFEEVATAEKIRKAKAKAEKKLRVESAKSIKKSKRDRIAQQKEVRRQQSEEQREKMESQARKNHAARLKQQATENGDTEISILTKILEQQQILQSLAESNLRSNRSTAEYTGWILVLIILSIIVSVFAGMVAANQ